MAGFASQDEGYSEDPLTAAIFGAAPFALKNREDSVTALGASRSGSDFPTWMIQHISNLSISRKTELAMALLNDLPTTVISQIVEQLNPRLYIDFIRYLPPEVCLKILGYLDPISLINVARSCRAWYELALDRKLWEHLYYMEGWKAKKNLIAKAEKHINGASSLSQGVLRRVDSEADGHAHKKRAIAVSPTVDADMDMVMQDADNPIKQEPVQMDTAETSLFGGPRADSAKTVVSSAVGNLEMHSIHSDSNSKGKGIDKGKGRALSPAPAPAPAPAPTTRSRSDFLSTVLASAPSRLPKSTLWILNKHDKYKVNWKHLYTMRRRLESNWELGKFVNFQLPHPSHPEEGHGECIYSLEFNAQYLVSGSRDRTLKVWDMESRRCLRTLEKHRGSVLCLQFDSDPDEDIIVSGSSDSNVIIWRFSTGEVIQTLDNAHRESVLNVKFDKRILVTCSKDKTIKVFNRRPLRYGDLGYQEVDPVGTNIQYGYNLTMTPDDLPQTPAWTMIGTLEGHGAAVNAVQIHEREVVSASGDRHIKVWDWPTQACSRTIVGHTKGIACVQYDGRRIVSGSSDREVKVFDRETGLEVASLRSHNNLVRTIQAGFGDLPYSAEDDAEEAKKVDQDYFKALESGLLEERERPQPGRRQGNAGSKRPEDICAYGAKLPPGGGGGKYGRIVSGSYDATIIIWRRDKEGIWKDQQHLKQEEAATAAMRQGRTTNVGSMRHPFAPQSSVGSVEDITATQIPLHASMRATVHGVTTHQSGIPAFPTATGSGAHASSRGQTSSAPPGPANGPTLPPLSVISRHLNQADGGPSDAAPSSESAQHLRRIIDEAIRAGPQQLLRAINAHSAILTQRHYLEAAIESVESAVTRSNLRQALSGAVIRAQFENSRLRREGNRNSEPSTPVLPGASSQASSQSRNAEAGSSAGGSWVGASPLPGIHLTPAQRAAAQAHEAHAQLPYGIFGTARQAPSPAGSPATNANPFSVPAPVQHHQQHLHPHAHPPIEDHDAANPARVFKLQYDARRIICCSQTSVIVGWDFCNGDMELEEASRFFETVE
ncbi:F-box/WD repeat-containing protein 1A [Podospora australis]|uniref:F-box/WD repeat-containing protein 1A n=1 Tax=Podospora australis TaxID=1536484 RepID=A0AAN6WTP1_9PEZI|nr:F-box/WD repeat-containing protein 1A [Podospora australis]